MIINEEKLVALCNKHRLTVPLHGFFGYEHDILDISKVFDKLHETCEDLSKEDFIEQMNTSPKPKILNDLFINIKTQGAFKIKGYDELSSQFYVECKTLDWL